MEAIAIREYQSSDREKLVTILKLNVPDYFAISEIDDFEYYLDNETERYFVAISEGKILGAGGINYEKDKGIAKISWDFIHPDHHRAGIGKRLLDHRMKLLESENLHAVIVRTSQLAYKFYEKNGFTLLDVQKNYWAEGFDMYYMVYKR